MSEFETIHRPRHVNIRKHQSDVATALQYPYGLVSARSFYDLKACILDNFHGAYTNQWFIFNDKHR
jgi:hypothetical protein